MPSFFHFRGPSTTGSFKDLLKPCSVHLAPTTLPDCNQTGNTVLLSSSQTTGNILGRPRTGALKLTATTSTLGGLSDPVLKRKIASVNKQNRKGWKDRERELLQAK